MSTEVWHMGGGHSGEKRLTRMILLSLGLHLFVFFIFSGFISGRGKSVKMYPAYTVDLVSLPGGGQSPGPHSELQGPPPQQNTPPAAKPVPLPKPLTEKSQKEKEDLTQSLDQALERLKKKVQQEKRLDQAINRMEDRLQREQALEKVISRLEQKQQPTAGEGGGGGDVTSAGVGSGGTGVGFRIYYAEVLSRIKRNWLLPENLLKRKDLSAVVMIAVQRSGRIEEVRFERKSGVEQFDQEVLRTLKKSDPLPPLPEGFPRNRHEIFLTFYARELS